jgi:hypothetical protein
MEVQMYCTRRKDSPKNVMGKHDNDENVRKSARENMQSFRMVQKEGCIITDEVVFYAKSKNINTRR